MNTDNNVDIVTILADQHEIAIFYGKFDGTFEAMVTFSTGHQSEPCAISVHDVNVDNRTDIIVLTCKQNDLIVYLNDGNGSFIERFRYGMSEPSVQSSMGMGDFDNDGHWDICVALHEQNSVAILLGFSNGTFAPSTLYTLPFKSQPVSLAVGDINNDHLLQILRATHLVY
jgi:hypothetical protein